MRKREGEIKREREEREWGMQEGLVIP